MATSTVRFVLDHEHTCAGTPRRNCLGAILALFLSTMVHADAVLAIAGLAGMILQARLLNLAAQFAAVRLLSLRCGDAAVERKQRQRNGCNSHIV
jgi:hypothetical protein